MRYEKPAPIHDPNDYPEDEFEGDDDEEELDEEEEDDDE